MAFVPYYKPILVCFTVIWKYRKKAKLTSIGNFIIIISSVEIILRAEAVEQAQAGDKCDFTGTLIVVPDVAQLSTPGTKKTTVSEMFYFFSEIHVKLRQ